MYPLPWLKAHYSRRILAIFFSVPVTYKTMAEIIILPLNGILVSVPAAYLQGSFPGWGTPFNGQYRYGFSPVLIKKWVSILAFSDASRVWYKEEARLPYKGIY